MQKEKMIRTIKWCLVVIWMLVIFNFSAQTAVESSALSDGIVDRMMDFMENFYHQVLGAVWQFPRKTLVFIVRKGAHMSVYFVLAILVVDRMMDFMENFYHQVLGAVWQFPRKTLVFIVRKGAHMSVYFVLAILVHGAWHPAASVRSKNIKTLILCTLYAISDECHQSFVPGRSAELRDVCVDTAGAVLGILVYMIFLLYRWKGKGDKKHVVL